MKATFGVGILILMLATRCVPGKDEGKLNELILSFDKFLRTEEFDYNSALQQLDSIDAALNSIDTKQRKNEHWESRIKYRWNIDSTITLIKLRKKFVKGFKREIILNYNDTTLFKYTFSTGPIGADNKVDYTYLETFEYSERGNPIRYLSRILWEQKVLSDTVKFRQQEFSDLTESIQEDWFDHSMDYAKRAGIELK